MRKKTATQSTADRSCDESTFWRAMGEPVPGAGVSQPRVAARRRFWLLLGASAVFGVMVGLMLVYSINLPQMAELARYRPSTTTELVTTFTARFLGRLRWSGGLWCRTRSFRRCCGRRFFRSKTRTSNAMAGSTWCALVGAAYQDVHSKGKAQGCVDADDAAWRGTCFFRRRRRMGARSRRSF